MFDNVILIGFDDDATSVSREGEFVTHDGRPVPAGLPVVDHGDWYEIEIPVDEDFTEWTECMKAGA